MTAVTDPDVARPQFGDRQHRVAAVAAAAAIAGQALFVGGWLLLGAIEGDGYSPGRHDVSDLGAVTAHHATAWLALLGVSGALTIAFALFALRPALTRAGLRSPIGPWLVALSLPALDNIGDVLFRLDCRAADAGCTFSQATNSWHGRAHLVVFVVALIPTLVAPFALARRMRLLDEWRDLARTTRRFGIGVIVGLLVNAASTDTDLQGWTQRGLIILVCAGVVVLAVRVLHLARSAPKSAETAGALAETVTTTR